MRSDHFSGYPKLRSPTKPSGASKRGDSAVLNQHGFDPLGLIPSLTHEVPAQLQFLPSGLTNRDFEVFQWLDPGILAEKHESLESLSSSLTGVLLSNIPSEIVSAQYKHIQAFLDVQATGNSFLLNLCFDPTLYELPLLNSETLPAPILKYVIDSLGKLPFVAHLVTTPAEMVYHANGFLFFGMEDDAEYIDERCYGMGEDEMQEWLESNPSLPSHLKENFSSYIGITKSSRKQAINASTSSLHEQLIAWSDEARKLKLTKTIESQCQSLLDANYAQLADEDCHDVFPALFLDMNGHAMFEQTMDELHQQVMQGDCASYFQLNLVAQSKPELNDAFALLEAIATTLRKIDSLIELTK